MTPVRCTRDKVKRHFPVILVALMTVLVYVHLPFETAFELCSTVRKHAVAQLWVIVEHVGKDVVDQGNPPL